MPLKLKPINVIKTQLGIQPNGEIHEWFTNTCALHMDKYVPWDTGHLAETVVVNGQINKENVTTNSITYNQPYAIYVYNPERNGKEITYQHDVHENAGPYWNERMWSAEKDIVVKEVQNYIDKRGG